MAITNYKKVENTKGYFLDDKDRKIFERTVSRGYFGGNPGDVVEFIIYDSNDNPLPQESAEGKTVRYIEYNDKTYKDYFGKTQINKSNYSSNQSEEFFIDVEKLLKEAGYTQGVFKTSITLLNKRLGSEVKENDSVWIHEISPSRTEIRILPTIDIEGKPNPELQAKYDTFVDGKTFNSDLYPFLDTFVEQFDVQKVVEEMYKLKGRTSTGVNYVKLIESEFKIPNFEIFIQRVKDKYLQAIKYFRLNYNYDINSPLFGQPNNTPKDISYSNGQILNTAISIITDCIEFYLPKRNINDQNAYTEEEQQTLDELEELRETIKDGNVIQTQIPPTTQEPIIGCMDPNALNYNPNATVDDRRLCVYVAPEVDVVRIPTPVEPTPPPIEVLEPTPPPIDIPADLPKPPPPGPPISLSDRPKPTDEVPRPIPVPTPKPKPLPIISLSDRKPPKTDDIKEVKERIDAANLGAGGKLNPLSGIDLDLNNQTEKALATVLTNTFNQVNEKATQNFFEEIRNSPLTSEPPIPGETSTITITAKQFENLSSNDRINLGSTSSGGSVVLDKNIRRKDINQL